MSVYWKEYVFKGMALSLSVFAGSFMIMLFSSSLSLFLFPFLCVCLCVCVRAHASWEQDQTWARKAGSSKWVCPADQADRGVEVERDSAGTHTCPFSMFLVNPVICVSSCPTHLCLTACSFLYSSKWGWVSKQQGSEKVHCVTRSTHF